MPKRTTQSDKPKAKARQERASQSIEDDLKRERAREKLAAARADVTEAEAGFAHAKQRLAQARRALAEVEREALGLAPGLVEAATGKGRSSPEQIGLRVLLAALVFWPLASAIFPNKEAAMFVVRFGFVGIALLFLRFCPAFNEELTVDPKGRAWQALAGVGAGAAFGIGRALLSESSVWGGTASYQGMVGAIANTNYPVLGMVEAFPFLILFGVLEAIVYGGMLRWVVTAPRGPLPPFASAVLVGVFFGWMHLLVPHFLDQEHSVPFALVGLVNGVLAALATQFTRSPLAGGAFLGVQWWTCLAFLFLDQPVA